MPNKNPEPDYKKWLSKKNRRSWNHKKFKKPFMGYYTRLKGERVLNLTNGTRTITFESWQMAKRLGWTLTFQS
jgi:hypothetical protein